MPRESGATRQALDVAAPAGSIPISHARPTTRCRPYTHSRPARRSRSSADEGCARWPVRRVRVAAEYVALPITAMPVAGHHGAGMRWIAHTVLTVPSGRSVATWHDARRAVARRWPRLLGLAGHHLLVGRLR